MEHTLQAQTSGQIQHCDRLIIETSLHLVGLYLSIIQPSAPQDIYLMTENINNILLANIHLGLVVLDSNCQTERERLPSVGEECL